MFSPVLNAQVKLELLLDQDQFLVKESVEIGVRVVNHSGQTLNLKKGDWLSVSVVDSDDFAVRQIGAMPIPEDVSIESSYMATQWLDIGETFDFRENSRYTVRARLDVKDWKRDYYSKAKNFEMIRGASLWEQKIGVPTEQAGGVPEFRTYVLQQALYLKKPQLYVRITDESGNNVYAVQRIAPMIQVSRPEAQVDTLSRLHVFTQVSMKDFVHVVIDPKGDIQQRHTYQIGGYRPSLKVSPSGGVFVAGGVRKLRRTDIPTPAMYLASAEDLKIDAEVDAQIEQKESAVADQVPETPEPVPTTPEVDPIEKALSELEKRTVEESAPKIEKAPEE